MKCDFCNKNLSKGMENQNPYVVTFDDKQFSFVSCSNAKCKAIKSKIKTIIVTKNALKKQMQENWHYLTNLANKEDYHFKKVRTELRQIRFAFFRVEKKIHDKSILLKNYQNLEAKIIAIRNNFIIDWEEKHSSFISTHIQLETGNRYWLWAIPIAIASLIIGTVSLILQFLGE